MRLFYILGVKCVQRRPKAPAKAVNWKGKVTHIHSGFTHRMMNIAIVLTPKTIQSRLRFSVYSSLFFIVQIHLIDPQK